MVDRLSGGLYDLCLLMFMTFCGALPLTVGGTHDLPLTHRMWQRGWDAAPMIMLLSTEFHLASRLAGLEEASCYEARGPVGEACNGKEPWAASRS